LLFYFITYITNNLKATKQFKNKKTKHSNNNNVIILLLLLFDSHRCNDYHSITVLGIAPMIGALVIAPMMNYY